MQDERDARLKSAHTHFNNHLMTLGNRLLQLHVGLLKLKNSPKEGEQETENTEQSCVREKGPSPVK